MRPTCAPLRCTTVFVAMVELKCTMRARARNAGSVSPMASAAAATQAAKPSVGSAGVVSTFTWAQRSPPVTYPSVNVPPVSTLSR